tara:strand:+ start:3832 stop:5664 length:1833 start_codon:yes stop_codon:yes gene_type:complete
MNNFRVDASTFASIKQDLVDRMKANPAFQDYDFLGSRLSSLMDVLAYNTLYSQAYSNAALMESFQSTAQNRNSIVLKAQELGYKPAGRLSASTELNITISSGASLDRYTTFEGVHPDGTTYNFVNWDQSSFISSAGFNDTIDIVQGELRYKQFTWVDNTTRLLVRDGSIDRTRIRLTINDIDYLEADNSARVGATDLVFYTRETIDGFTEIYFGEGVIETRTGQEDIDRYIGGLKPINNDIIKIEYLSCRGASANGATDFTLTGSTTPTTTVTINNPTVVSSTGADKETKERIKTLAPKMNMAQNRAVTADDYQVLVLQEYGSYIDSILAWGDESRPGFAFISIKPTDGLSLPQSVKTSIEKFLSKYNILTVQALVIDPDYMFIDHDIEVDYRIDQLKTNEGGLEDGVLTAINSYYNANVEEFKSSFHVSKLLSFIDSSNTAILGSSAVIKMIKELASIIDSDGVKTFNNPIKLRGITSNDILFTSLDTGTGSYPIRLLSTDDGKIVAGPFTVPDISSGINQYQNPELFDGGDDGIWYDVGVVDYVLGDFKYDMSAIFSDLISGDQFELGIVVLKAIPTETDIYTKNGQLIAFEDELRPQYTQITLEGIS